MKQFIYVEGEFADKMRVLPWNTSGKEPFVKIKNKRLTAPYITYFLASDETSLPIGVQVWTNADYGDPQPGWALNRDLVVTTPSEFPEDIKAELRKLLKKKRPNKAVEVIELC